MERRTASSALLCAQAAVEGSSWDIWSFSAYHGCGVSRRENGASSRCEQRHSSEIHVHTRAALRNEKKKY